MTEFSALYPALRRAPTLASLGDAHFEGLLRVMKMHRFAPGEVFFREGRPGDSMAVIAAGEFRVSVTAPDGSQREIGTLGPGEVVGEMVCVDPAPRSATVTATKPSVVFLLSRSMLLALKERGPAVAMALLTGVVGQVTDRIRKIHARLDEQITAAEKGRQAPAGPRVRDFPEADSLTPQLYKGPVDLGRVSALSDFSQADREILKTVSRTLCYPPGAVLCREGDRGTSCFIVVDGEVGVHKLVGGKTRLLTSLGGCLLGQMALVDPSPRSATLRTRTAVVALELTRDTFQQLLGEHSPCALRFQELLAVTGIRQLREATTRLASLRSEAAPPKPPEVKATPAPPVGRAPLPQARPPLTTPTTARLDVGPLVKQPVKPASPPKRKGPLPLPSMRHPRNDSEALQMTLSYMQASLQEWGMDMEDLDNIRTVRPDGIMSPAERNARMNRR
ncbi:MAG: cyclic nucleotide-binding domain-containing protein [Pseudomonadota bacterium]